MGSKSLDGLNTLEDDYNLNYNVGEEDLQDHERKFLAKFSVQFSLSAGSSSHIKQQQQGNVESNLNNTTAKELLKHNFDEGASPKVTCSAIGAALTLLALDIPYDEIAIPIFTAGHQEFRFYLLTIAAQPSFQFRLHSLEGIEITAAISISPIYDLESVAEMFERMRVHVVEMAKKLKERTIKYHLMATDWRKMREKEEKDRKRERQHTTLESNLNNTAKELLKDNFDGNNTFLFLDAAYQEILNLNFMHMAWFVLPCHAGSPTGTVYAPLICGKFSGVSPARAHFASAQATCSAIAAALTLLTLDISYDEIAIPIFTAGYKEFRFYLLTIVTKPHFQFRRHSIDGLRIASMRAISPSALDTEPVADMFERMRVHAVEISEKLSARPIKHELVVPDWRNMAEDEEKKAKEEGEDVDVESEVSLNKLREKQAKAWVEVHVEVHMSIQSFVVDGLGAPNPIFVSAKTQVRQFGG
ncbi:hypothetical protein HDU76_001972 [Blyttiomyces sp. JEL0837]|nr:hypothetical protein HDU76_001972 [Blyttiomyces sp. JEL0837]